MPEELQNDKHSAHSVARGKLCNESLIVAVNDWHIIIKIIK